MEKVQSPRDASGDYFPSLREYVDVRLDHPAVEPAVFHSALVEVLVELPALRDTAVDLVLAQELEERRTARVDPASNEALFLEWLVELVEGEVRVDEVVDGLPVELVERARESAVAEHRPWVLEVQRRESWICTATGERGSGDVAVIRPRVEGDSDFSGEAVLSPAALGMALAELVRREAAEPERSGLVEGDLVDGEEPDRFSAYVMAQIQQSEAPAWMRDGAEPDLEVIQAATPDWFDVSAFDEVVELAKVCAEVHLEALRLMGPFAEVLRRFYGLRGLCNEVAALGAVE